MIVVLFFDFCSKIKLRCATRGSLVSWKLVQLVVIVPCLRGMVCVRDHSSNGFHRHIHVFGIIVR